MTSKTVIRWSIATLLTASLAACGGGGGAADTGPDASTNDTGTYDADVIVDPGGSDLPSDPGAAGDSTGDGGEVLPQLPVHPPVGQPADPLEGTGIQSCPVYLEQRCDGGKLMQCALYDTKNKSWVEKPDPLLRRVLLYDRWRDLYNSPDGQAVDRDFKGAVMPGTPEDEWSDPDAFAGYWGAGDGGIWTGWATVAAILRYSQTGTQADYQRMERYVRDLLTMFEVTGIPGYLSRYHFLLMPAGAPNTPEHILRWEDSFTPSYIDHVFDPKDAPDLPDVYTDGITDEEGKVWKGTPMWHGRPSIDQNTGPMTAFPMAYALLRDEDLKDRIARQMTCYLKRLQRIEIINLQSNKDLLDTLVAYFATGELKLDPDDLDLTKIDRIVGYVHLQINSLNEDTFDRSCPDHVQLKPWRVIDAAGDTFLLDFLELIQDMQAYDLERENGINHYYFPSIRGGDAMHLMHLAAMAYYFTGDEEYRSFLYDELIPNIHTIEVAHTAGAFDLPKFCKKYYGDQITYGPWWAFIELLGDGPLRTEMEKAFHGELWSKLLKDAGNVDFDIMYAGALSPDIATESEQALTYAMDNLPLMGGNGGLLMGDPYAQEWLDDPRRTYTSTPDQVMAWTPDGIQAVCPTEKEIAACNQEIEFMGIKFPALASMDTHECTGSQWECDLGDGKCTNKMASGPLPPPLRPSTDFLWQRNPYQLGRPESVEGHRQFAGSDLSEPYWNARRYGFITEGAGQVLAWKETGDCTP